jgi:hypothetical protein
MMRSFLLAMLVAACTGGGSTDATSSSSTSSGATSSSSGSTSSGSSSSSGSSGDASVNPLTCTELPDGGTVGASLGGSQASQTKVQAALDYASVAASSARELATLCAQMASDLGVSKSDVDGASAEADDAKRVTAVCNLAKSALATARASDAVDLHATAPTCTVPATTTCEAGCVPASGGCSAMCDASARAKASCPVPQVAATGASSSALTATLNAHFGAVLALDARLRGMAQVAGTLTSAMASITDIKPACIPPVVSVVQHSVEQLSAGVEASSDLKTAVGAS